MNKKLIIALLVLIILIVLRVIFNDLLSFNMLQENKEQLINFVDENYLFAVIGFILIYIIVIGLSIPGATVLTITGGFLFGSFLGTVYTNIGATAGAIIVFLLARYLIGDWVQKKWKKQLTKINQDIAKNGFSYLLTLRFIPLFPFFLINLAAGISKVNLRTFAWTTSIGIIPGSFVYAFAGNQISLITSVESILSPGIILALIMLGLLAAIPVILKKTKVISNA